MRPLLKLAPLVAFACLTATALGPAAARADDTSVSDEARRHFRAGVAFLKDPDGERVEEAYREFKVAYDLSHSPKVLGNLGVCAMKLERDGEAIEAFTHYLREVTDIEPDERAQVTQDLGTLTVSAARVVVNVDAPDVRIVDSRVPVRGDQITNSYGPFQKRIELTVRPGFHRLTIKAAGFADEARELDLAAGAREEMTIALHRPSPASTGSRGEAERASSGSGVGPYVVLGAGGLMMAGGAVSGLMTLGKVHDIDRACPRSACPANYDLTAARSSARTFVTTTDILLIGGGALAAGGLVWLLLSHAGRAEQPRGYAPETSAACTGAGCSVTAKVAF